MQSLAMVGLLSVLLGTALFLSREKNTEEQTIRELDVAWSRALQKRDLDKAMADYADDAVFLPPDVPMVEGKVHIRERFAQRMSMPGYSASFTTARMVVSEAQDMAYEIGTFSVTIDNDQGKPVIRSGKHLVTWQKRSGKWEVVAESINYDAPTPLQ